MVLKTSCLSGDFGIWLYLQLVFMEVLTQLVLSVSQTPESPGQGHVGMSVRTIPIEFIEVGRSTLCGWHHSLVGISEGTLNLSRSVF